MMTMPFDSSVSDVRADTGGECVSRWAGRHGGLPLQWPFQLHEP